MIAYICTLSQLDSTELSLLLTLNEKPEEAIQCPSPISASTVEYLWKVTPSVFLQTLLSTYMHLPIAMSIELQCSI